MVESTLQQFIYGRSINGKNSADAAGVLAKSSEISADDAAAVYQFVALDPLPKTGQSFALISLDSSALITATGRLVLARAHFQAQDSAVPIHQFVFLSREAFIRLGDVEPLLKLFPEPIPSDAVPALEPLALPLPLTWTLDKSAFSLREILDCLHLNMPKLLGLLDMALNQGVRMPMTPL